jgi:TonB family protein
MPQEFLRDVLRTGDVKGRRRRLSVLPLSIAIHAIVLTAFLISPWIVEADLPIVGSPLQAYVASVTPPAPPPPNPPVAMSPKNTSAPLSAPDTIAEETPEAPKGPPVDGGLITGPGVESSGSVLVGLSVPTPVALPPPPIPTPKYVKIYPEIARISRIEGKVTMEAILDATGKVESVRVLSAQPLLEDAAVRAVRQWRYTPTELNGVPVPVLMTITVVFSLAR